MSSEKKESALNALHEKIDEMSEMLSNFVFEVERETVKECIEQDYPWLTTDLNVELAISFRDCDDDFIRSKKISLAKLILSQAEDYCNEYWCSADKPPLRRIVSYLSSVVERLNTIIDKSVDMGNSGSRATEDEQKQFQRLFDDPADCISIQSDLSFTP